MNKLKWYQKLLIALMVIIFSPLIIAGIIIAGIDTLFQMPKNKKEYKKSRYYADFKQKFMTSILYSPEYRFYNSAMRRNLQLKYVKQESNGFEYFIHNETIYLFPDFEQIDFNEEGNIWQADYDGDWKPFDECYANWLAKLESAPNYPVKLLVERKMFPTLNLNDKDIPDCIFVTWNYENAFENEESPLKMIIPQNSKELYEMMLQTPDLCGKFELVDKTIFWNLFDGYDIQISIEPPETHFSIEKRLFWKITDMVTHWHPEQEDIYDEVCKIGIKGNVLVVRKNLLFTSTIYMGKEELCPYSSKKWSWGKIYYLKAK